MWILIETGQIRIMINNVYLAIPKECPHLKPHLLPGDLFISITFKRGGGARLNQPGSIFEMGALFCLAKTMVSVLLKELQYKAENTSMRSWRSCSQGSIRDPNCQLVNKPSWVSPHEVLQLWLITGNTVKWRIIRERDRGHKREGGLLTFFPWKGGGLLKRGA